MNRWRVAGVDWRVRLRDVLVLLCVSSSSCGFGEDCCRRRLCRTGLIISVEVVRVRFAMWAADAGSIRNGSARPALSHP